jgi:outer membrane protein, multidrug efflux system
MGPRPMAPAQASVSPPAAWRESPALVEGTVTEDWWRTFQEPALTRLVEHALANNDDLNVALTRVREADARVRLARSAQKPSVDLDFLGFGRERTYSTVTGNGLNFSAYKLDAAVAYDVDLFGRLAQQTAAARAQLLATKAARDAIRITIVADAITAYSGLLELDASREIVVHTLDDRRRQLRMLQHQLAEGYVQRVAVSEASSAVHATEQQLVQIDLNRREHENALSVLLGDVPGEIERGRGLLELSLPDAPASLPAQLLRQRPDVYAAEQAVVAADHSLDSARAAFMPDIKLNATAGRLDADVLPAALQIWSFSTSVLAPIYEGGKLRANQDLAAAQRDQAAFSYRKTALTAFQEVESTLTACRLLAEKEQAVAAERDDDAATLRLAQRRFDQGYTSYLEVLDAERALLATELALVQTRAARFAAHIKLYQSVGGGWSRS